MTNQTRTREETSVLHRCLSHSRRRRALSCLEEAGEPLAVADLAEEVADRESDLPRSEIGDEAIADAHVSLYHVHVPKLADAGLVRYDREGDAVQLSESGEETEDGDPLLVSG